MKMKNAFAAVNFRMVHFCGPDGTLCHSRRNFMFVMAALTTCLLAGPASAGNAGGDSISVPDIAADYPKDSIKSIEIAERALEEAARARTLINERYAREERACYERFFASSCVDDAKERRRIALSEVRSVEVDANAFKRHARVMERDEALAEKNRQAESQSSGKQETAPANAAASPAEAGTSSASPRQDEGNAKKPSGAPTGRPHTPKPKPGPAEEAAEAKKRAENIAAYERKIQKIQEHQRAVEARKAEKQKERADKQASPKP